MTTKLIRDNVPGSILSCTILLYSVPLGSPPFVVNVLNVLIVFIYSVYNRIFYHKHDFWNHYIIMKVYIPKIINFQIMYQ